MKLNKTLIALALGAASVSSFADDFAGALDLSGGNAGYFRAPTVVPTLTFMDTYSFTLLAASQVLVGITTNSANPVDVQDIDFSNVFITNVAGTTTFATAVGGGTDQFETRMFNPVVLASGNYVLHIEGAQATANLATYSGNLQVSAVPEPETYALMLAGLGALGFIARRRRKV